MERGRAVADVIEPAGAAYRGAQVQLDLPRLASGDRVEVRAPDGDEAVVVLLEGAIECAGVRAERPSVFSERAFAVHLPPGVSVDVVAHDDTELALAATVDGRLRRSPEAVATVVRPSDVVVHDRGRAGWRRAVHDVVADRVHAQRLVVGETFNEPGGWSSFPPHKHDGADGERVLEEVYYFRFDRPDGFGFQGLYERDAEPRAVFLRHDSVVGIPRGYHPVCCAPGYRCYYLWALAGVERDLDMYEDPAHRWLHDVVP
jgi:5-deoxy-glucuronate isomerase